MTAKPQNEPTLAEIVARAKEKTACADNYVCLRQDVADCHARAKALAEGWNTESRNARVQRAILKDYGKQLLAILGDLKP